jgi:hypothetical protein
MTGRDGSSVLLLFPASVCVPLAAPSRTTAEQIALAPTPVHLWMFASRRTHPKQEERVPRIRRGGIDANGADVLRQHGEPAKQCVVSHHFLLFASTKRQAYSLILGCHRFLFSEASSVVYGLLIKLRPRRKLNRLIRPQLRMLQQTRPRRLSGVTDTKIRDVKKPFRMVARFMQTTALPAQNRHLCYTVHL